MGGTRLRSAAATWGSAAWLVLQQFGIPAAPRVSREHRIVRVQEAGDTLAAMERLPDGRVLTVSIAARRHRNRQDEPISSSIVMSPN